MEQRLSADVFIAPELLVNHKIDATLDPRIEPWVRSQPEVQRIVAGRSVTTQYAGKPTMLVGTDVAELLSDTGGRKSLPIKSKIAAPFDPADDVLISEPLAGRARVGAGGSIELQSPTGPHRFTVYAVFFDFGSERGQVMLDRRTYAADWKDPSISSLHVRLRPGLDPEQVAGRWDQALRANYPVVAHSFAHVKTEVLAVFDRTFKVTRVLSWLAGGVAFCGLAGSLLALALARQRDYSVLAAIGMSGRQTALWVLAQGLLIAWSAAAVASVAGSVLAYVLAYVIQYRSFGWSIPTTPQPRFWLEIFLLATVAALLAVVYPAHRLRSAPPAMNLRQE
jgi:putative ABC transport system permease protein